MLTPKEDNFQCGIYVYNLNDPQVTNLRNVVEKQGFDQNQKIMIMMDEVDVIHGTLDGDSSEEDSDDENEANDEVCKKRGGKGKKALRRLSQHSTIKATIEITSTPRHAILSRGAIDRVCYTKRENYRGVEDLKFVVPYGDDDGSFNASLEQAFDYVAKESAKTISIDKYASREHECGEALESTWTRMSDSTIQTFLVYEKNANAQTLERSMALSNIQDVMQQQKTQK